MAKENRHVMTSSAGPRESLVISNGGSQMTFHRGQSKFVPQINVQLGVCKNEMTVINDIEDESQNL